jgi:UDP-glucose 4-epimerase
VKALVTGAAGFIGSHLSERLLDGGVPVVGVDCFTDYYARAAKESNLAQVRQKADFEFVETSLGAANLPRLLDGVTHVFHLAAQAGVRRSWGRDFDLYTELNVDATQKLLEACVGRPLHRIVYASSSSVYGDHVPLPMREDALLQPLSPYGVTKLAAEHLCHLYHESYGLPTVSLRYFTVYGPRQRPDMAFHRFIRATLEEKPIVLYGDGEQTRDFTFVGDAVDATMAAGERGVPGGVYNVGGGSRVTINEVIQVLERVLGQRVSIDRQPAQRGDMRHTYADTSRARRDLDFVPSVTLEQGLTAEYRWVSSIL